MSASPEPISVKQPSSTQNVVKRRFSIIWNWVILIGLMFVLYSCIKDAIRQHQQNIDTRVSGYPATPTSQAKIDALAFYGNVQALMRKCDAENIDLMAGLYGTDRVTQYQSAQAIKANCEIDSNNNEIANLKIPESLGHDYAREVGVSSLECNMAKIQRVLAALSLEDGIKGSGNVKKLAEARDYYSVAERYRASCRDGFLNATKPLGISEADLPN